MLIAYTHTSHTYYRVGALYPCQIAYVHADSVVGEISGGCAFVCCWVRGSGTLTVDSAPSGGIIPLAARSSFFLDPSPLSLTFAARSRAHLLRGLVGERIRGRGRERSFHLAPFFSPRTLFISLCARSCISFSRVGDATFFLALSLFRERKGETGRVTNSRVSRYRSWCVFFVGQRRNCCLPGFGVFIF